MNGGLAKLVNEDQNIEKYIVLGKTFYEQAVPDGVQQALQESASPYILLETEDSGIPWELFHDGTDFWGCRYFISRSLISPGAVPTALATAPEPGQSRALVVVNPTADLPAAGWGRAAPAEAAVG